MPSNQQELTTKQIDAVEVFCLNYIKDFDHVSAWKTAHPDKDVKSPAARASQFLATDRVQTRLRELSRQYFNDLDQDIRDLIEETQRIASFNPLEIMDIDDEGKPSLNLKKAKERPEIMRMLDIEFATAIDKDGGKHHVYKVKFHNKMDALEKLYKFHKLYQAAGFEDKAQPIIINANFPLPGEYWKQGVEPPQDVIDIIEGESNPL